MKFNTRAYNTLQLSPNKTSVIKTSHGGIERLQNEESYYLSLPTKLKSYFPKYIKSHDSGFELEYVPWNNLWDYSNNNRQTQFWDNVAASLRDLLYRMQSIPGTEISLKCKEAMYVGKTETERKALAANNSNDFFSQRHSHLLINNKSFRSFESIWPEVKQQIAKKLLIDRPGTVIHGDLCFANILADKTGQQIKLVDPRGSFGVVGIYGDPLYDYAKLLHSTDGRYESIINDNFTIEADGNSLNFEFHSTNEVANSSIQTILQEQDFDAVRLIEGLIYIGMCARHFDSVNHQLVMYATGVRLLNECVEK